jgi:hypothetical protein
MVNSFTVFAVGVLARNPEVFIDQGETAARFCLVGNDFEEIDGAVREFVTSVCSLLLTQLPRRCASARTAIN